MLSLSLSPSLIRENVIRAIMAGLVPFVQSSPGLGKSDIGRSIADEFNLKMIDCRLTQCEPTDLSGLPRFREDGKVEYAPFVTFPLLGDELPPKLDAHGKVQFFTNAKNEQEILRYDGWLLFFDEANSAMRATQAAAYKIVLDRMVGDNLLHPKVAMMMAGNLSTDKAITYDLSTAMQSRLIHLEMELSKADWIKWAIENDVDTRITAFIEFRGDLLHTFKPDHNDKTFACPRTWWFLNKLVKGKIINNADLPLFAGTVSQGPAQEFITFVQIFDGLPKLSEIAADPERTPVPYDMGTRYAMVAYLSNNLTDERVEPFLTYIQRFPVEQQVLALRMMKARYPKILMKPIFKTILTKLGNFL